VALQPAELRGYEALRVRQQPVAIDRDQGSVVARRRQKRYSSFPEPNTPVLRFTFCLTSSNPNGASSSCSSAGRIDS
jgi:hypothetical protein